MPDIRKMVQDQRDFIINNRRMLHLIPETAFEEKKTGASIGECLEKEGLQVQKEIAGTGVVGLMETEKKGSSLLLALIHFSKESRGDLTLFFHISIRLMGLIILIFRFNPFTYGEDPG